MRHMAVEGESEESRAGRALVAARAETKRPSALICKTLIGKGVSFMENQPGWHGVAPGDDEARKALLELGISEDEVASMVPASA